MSSTHLEPVTTSAAWRGDELIKKGDWIYHLSADQISELETLGAELVGNDPDLRRIEVDDYPLQACRDAIEDWKQRMDVGHGFVLVRGLRTELYSDALSAAIYYILGLHLGEPMRQNELGDLIDHIYATSDKKLEDPSALSKSIRDKLPFHSDSSDIVALMCLRPSMEGGASCLVSGAQIYNEIVRRRPDLAPLLMQPFHWDWLRQDPAAPANTYTSPIISIVDGVFSMYAGSLYILTAQDYPEVPRLTDAQRELLQLFEDITYEPGMAIEMDFRPGDIQWLSNYAALHSRTEFTDYPEPQRRRHLLRLWLRRREQRPITPGFGKSVVQNRTSHRDTEADDSRGNFRIINAAVPRIIA
ncbi:TauD/TfdA family dioxygenase [Xanthomonas sp. WHRI 1810A]|uniref:TauD/TfdA family dioxygenase n=1 Tax=Xanthomonas sp. WHRI 1810A TaxID=3161565 RepID=UPI0032E87C60